MGIVELETELKAVTSDEALKALDTVMTRIDGDPTVLDEALNGVASQFTAFGELAEWLPQVAPADVDRTQGTSREDFLGDIGLGIKLGIIVLAQIAEVKPGLRAELADLDEAKLVATLAGVAAEELKPGGVGNGSTRESLCDEYPVLAGDLIATFDSDYIDCVSQLEPGYLDNATIEEQYMDVVWGMQICFSSMRRYIKAVELEQTLS